MVMRRTSVTAQRCCCVTRHEILRPEGAGWSHRPGPIWVTPGEGNGGKRLEKCIQISSALPDASDGPIVASVRLPPRTPHISHRDAPQGVVGAPGEKTFHSPMLSPGAFGVFRHRSPRPAPQTCPDFTGFAPRHQRCSAGVSAFCKRPRALFSDWVVTCGGLSVDHSNVG